MDWEKPTVQNFQWGHPKVILKVSSRNFTRIEKPSIILLLLNNRKLPPHWTEMASGSYLGKLHKEYWGGAALIVKCNSGNLKEIMKQVDCITCWNSSYSNYKLKFYDIVCSITVFIRHELLPPILPYETWQTWTIIMLFL